MFIEIIILAVVMGYILGGSISKFKDADLRHIELIFAAFIYESVLILLIRKGFHINSMILYPAYLLMYIILFIFVYLNRHSYEVVIMGIGFLLNALVIFTNGGRMPVSSSALNRAGLGYMLNNNSLASRGCYRLLDDKTLLPLLGDIIPKPFIPPAVVSPGDIVIGISLFLLIIRMMGCKKVFNGKHV